jgi:acetyl esterase
MRSLYGEAMTALDASAAALLEAITASPRPPVELGTPEEAQEAHLAAARFLSGPGEPIADIIEGQVDEVTLRVYRPEGAAPGAILYAHGGGWVTGTLDSYDPLYRALANRAGVSLIAVDYGLAPELRHPHAAGQVMKAVQAAMTDGAPLALAGDSAGAHLVTIAASVAGKVGIPFKALGLIYPVVSPALDTPSWDELGTGYGLTREAMRWYWDQYLNPEPVTTLASDLLELDLSGLPPTLVVTAGFDPLRDEGLALAAAIEKAGAPVERLSWDGQMHGFVRSMAQIPEAYDALDRVGAFLRAHLVD